jgi:hypothetical protein
MHTVIGLLKMQTGVIVEDGFCPLDIKRYDLRYHNCKQDQPDDNYDLVNPAGIVCEAKAHAFLNPKPPVLWNSYPISSGYRQV